MTMSRLRPNDSALSSQVVTDPVGHSLLVLSGVHCQLSSALMCLECAIINDVTGVHSRHIIGLQLRMHSRQAQSATTWL